MKAVFIAYNQAYNEEIADILQQFGQRGFTRWDEIQGRGSETGIPRMGSHAWPTMNHAILTMVKDEKVEAIMADLRDKDEKYKDLGLRAFVWNIEMFY